MLTINHLLPLFPELFVLSMACLILLIGVVVKNLPQLTYYLVQVVIVLAALLTLYIYHIMNLDQAIYFFHAQHG